MIELVRTSLWSQFGAAIDTLDQAIRLCPAELWHRGTEPEVWHLAYHTTFWLDFYISDCQESEFVPTPPFGLTEFENGAVPEVIPTQDELRAALATIREKCRAHILGMTEESAAKRFVSGWMDFPRLQLHSYNMRHVQHHSAQINMLLRAHAGIGARWVSGKNTL